MDQLLTLMVPLVVLFFVSGVLVQMTGALFGNKPDWFASLRWLARSIRKGAYRVLITIANMFRDGAHEINRSVRNQPMWQRAIFGISSLLPLSIGIIFFIPAQILKPPGKKK